MDARPIFLSLLWESFAMATDAARMIIDRGMSGCQTRGNLSCGGKRKSASNF
jgi:hypothetical protein